MDKVLICLSCKKQGYQVYMSSTLQSVLVLNDIEINYNLHK